MSDNIATTNTNSHYMTRTSPFFYGEQMKSWANTPMGYALDIAIENKLSDLLELPLDRIIYASNEYCFRERTRKNEGDLNLPFLNYYRKSFGDSNREWFNDYSNRFGLIDRQNKFTSLLGGRLRVYPVSIGYEATVFFAQDKDCQYAMNKLLFESSNETIIEPQIETDKGDIIKNTGNVTFNLEYMPNYQESDWLEQNRIWSIDLDFEVDTFMIGNFNPLPDRDKDGNPMPLHVAKSALLEFFSAKKINYENYNDSEQMEWILERYFENQI